MRQNSSAMTSASILSAVPTRLESGCVIPELMVSTALAVIGPTFKELAVVPAQTNFWLVSTDHNLFRSVAYCTDGHLWYRIPFLCAHTTRDCSALLN
jgi:hypothetical protein